MTNNILTAEEFYQQAINDKTIGDDITDLMNAYAKMHVTAALKQASEKAKIKYEYSGNTGSEYCYEYVDQNSIVNSYPLDNIK